MQLGGGGIRTSSKQLQSLDQARAAKQRGRGRLKTEQNAETLLALSPPESRSTRRPSLIPYEAVEHAKNLFDDFSGCVIRSALLQTFR